MLNQKYVGLALAGAVIVGAAGYFGGTWLSRTTTDATATAATVGATPVTHLTAATDAPATAEAPAASAIDVAALSDGQREEVEGIIRNYLIANPEIIRDAINELQRRTEEAEQAEQVKAIADNRDLLFSSPRQIVLGNPDGKVTLVEFFDYNCGYCKRAHADMKRLIEGDKDLRVVIKEFPVLGDHSVEAAQISIAVKMLAPEKAPAFFEALINEKGQVNGARALAVAEELGLDRAKVTEASKSDEVKETIGEVYGLATKLSLTGTPSYVTAQEVVVGAVGFDALREKLDAVRAAEATPVEAPPSGG
jgi:protein-disulfide isomerase